MEEMPPGDTELRGRSRAHKEHRVIDGQDTRRRLHGHDQDMRVAVSNLSPSRNTHHLDIFIAQT